MLGWRRPVWRKEDGPGYQMRQYVGRRPTGLVAITAWDDPAPHRSIAGPDVWLVCEATRVTVTERRDARPGAVRLEIPFRSCVDVTVVDEPGLPGNALVRLTLTVQIGSTTTFAVPLWFPMAHRPLLDELARRIRARARPQPDQMPPLEVDQAPDRADWVVFRPARTSEDVVVPRAPVGEGRR
jgi:hypothetical protein